MDAFPIEIPFNSIIIVVIIFLSPTPLPPPPPNRGLVALNGASIIDRLSIVITWCLSID